MTTTDEKGMFDFDLDAFKAKRDDAQSKELRWEATSFEIKQAYEAGERNLEGANLYGANLEGANLYGANLEGANLEGANGIYSAYAPNLSSRGATLTGGVIVKDGKIQLRFWAGCKQRMTDKKLLEYVKKTHDDNIHAKQYKAAINFIKACFKADMAANKWDYLLTWKPVELVKGK